MGMTEAGGIAKLVQVGPPDMAVITKIGHAHVSSFADGLEGVARAKAEILSHPKTEKCVINVQAMQFKALCREALKNPITYGVEPAEADYVLRRGHVIEEKGKGVHAFELPFEETHFCENFAAAATVARQLGLSWEEIAERAKFLKGFEKRFEKIEREGVVFVNDCYNANPESMRAALDNLPRPRMGAKVVAVFAEMPGLGALSEKCHKELAEYALQKVDHMLCYGKGALPMLGPFGLVGRPAEFFNDLQKLKKTLFELSKPGDVVLIKGRNDDKLWQLLEG
jgi:UDP-N-acetylmuramoyl-tripeptide--D-alanyl-D-alanine ligase